MLLGSSPSGLQECGCPTALHTRAYKSAAGSIDSAQAWQANSAPPGGFDPQTKDLKCCPFQSWASAGCAFVLACCVPAVHVANLARVAYSLKKHGKLPRYENASNRQAHPRVFVMLCKLEASRVWWSWS